MSEIVAASDAEVVFRMRMGLGEGPLWDPSAQRLYWTDLMNQKLYRGDPSTGKFADRTLPYKASRVTQCDDGRLLVSFTRGPALGTFDGDEFEPATPGFSWSKETRINDGACDARGRFWTGTYDPTLQAALGSIYCIERGSVTRKTAPVRLSNGIRFSPDNRTMYFVDSTPGQIWAYDFDLDSATLGERRLLADFEGTGVKPDGCTIDTDGCVWVAEVNRARIGRYTPDGKLDQIVRVPVLKPTSVSFGGAAGNLLFITSRHSPPALGEPDDPLAGSVFVAQVNATGLTEHSYACGR